MKKISKIRILNLWALLWCTALNSYAVSCTSCRSYLWYCWQLSHRLRAAVLCAADRDIYSTIMCMTRWVFCNISQVACLLWWTVGWLC